MRAFLKPSCWKQNPLLGFTKGYFLKEKKSLFKTPDKGNPFYFGKGFRSWSWAWSVLKAWLYSWSYDSASPLTDIKAARKRLSSRRWSQSCVHEHSAVFMPLHRTVELGKNTACDFTLDPSLDPLWEVNLFLKMKWKEECYSSHWILGWTETTPIQPSPGPSR